jgi:hypothetical protein
MSGGFPNMARMPSVLRSARLLLPPVLVVALVLCWPALAAAPVGIEVNVTKPDGTQESILTDEASQDIIDATYEVRRPNVPTEKRKITGISIRALLDELDAAEDYGKLEIVKPNGATLTLTKKQVDHILPPVLYADEAGKTWFLVDDGPHFALPGSAIAIEQIAAALKVEVEASPRRVEAGERVKLTASVTGGAAGDKYFFDWSFDDGKRKIDGGRTVSHRFAEDGSYKVVVKIESLADGAVRESGSVRVQVGDPEKSDEDREGGGDNGAAAAPDSGTSTGSSGGGYSYGDGYTPDTSAAPVTPAPTPVPPPPAPVEPTPPATATSGTSVEGNLLADVSDSAPSSALDAAARAARHGNPNDGAPDGADVSEAALSIAGVLALLGFGAGLESRQGRLPRMRLPLPRRGA